MLQEFVDELQAKETEMANAFKIADGFRDEAQVCQIFFSVTKEICMYIEQVFPQFPFYPNYISPSRQ